MNTKNDSTETITGVCISHIIFDDSDYVTLWASCRLGGAIKQVHLVGSVRHMNDILRYSGSKGEEILLGMADAILHSPEPPYVVALKQLLGHVAVLTSCRLDVLPAQENEATTNKGHNVYWIERVEPLSQLQQAKNLAQHIRDFGTADAVTINTKQQCIDLANLAKKYNYYLGLLELDINEDAARNKSGLVDERLFEMAKML
jgi:hypothetical protein